MGDATTHGGKIASDKYLQRIIALLKPLVEQQLKENQIL